MPPVLLGTGVQVALAVLPPAEPVDPPAGLVAPPVGVVEPPVGGALEVEPVVPPLTLLLEEEVDPPLAELLLDEDPPLAELLDEEESPPLLLLPPDALELLVEAVPPFELVSLDDPEVPPLDDELLPPLEPPSLLAAGRQLVVLRARSPAKLNATTP